MSGSNRDGIAVSDPPRGARALHFNAPLASDEQLRVYYHKMKGKTSTKRPQTGTRHHGLPKAPNFLDSTMSRRFFSLTTSQTSQGMFSEKMASSQGMHVCQKLLLRSPKKQCKNLLQTKRLSQKNGTLKNAHSSHALKAKNVIIETPQWW